MKKKTKWYFFYKERNKEGYTFFGERICKLPRRTKLYKELQILGSSENVLSYGWTLDKKEFE